MKKSIVILFYLMVSFSCNHNSSVSKESNDCKHYLTNAIEQANWFVGSWHNITKYGLFYENWKQLNDSLYKGESYIIQNKDTVFYEALHLEKKDNEWYYIVNIRGQDKKEPVSFKLTSVSLSQLVFENSKHDFPTKITYLKISEDSIVASIFGLIDGKENIEQFPMKKIKSYAKNN